MSILKGINKIDKALIKLILAGDFEMMEADSYTSQIKCGGVNLSFWMCSNADGLKTYEQSRLDGRYYYHMNEVSNKEEIFNILVDARDPGYAERELKEKREQFEKLKLELGEV